METALKEEIIGTFGEIRKTIISFSQEQLNAMPDQGWTAAQVAEHIIKATSGFPSFFNGRTETTQRKKDEKVASLQKVFLDFTIKMQAPEFILPTDTAHLKTTLLQSLQKIENELTAIVETEDLSMVCIDFEMPGFGQLTRYEWVSFALMHTQRHTHQLKNILTALI